MDTQTTQSQGSVLWAIQVTLLNCCASDPRQSMKDQVRDLCRAVLQNYSQTNCVFSTSVEASD